MWCQGPEEKPHFLRGHQEGFLVEEAHHSLQGQGGHLLKERREEE